MLTSFHDAVHLTKTLKWTAIEHYLGLYEDSDMDIEDEDYLKRWDIEGDSLLRAFGIFTVFFAVILGLILIYWLTVCLKNKCWKEMKHVHSYLHRKLFFSSLIRYMIQANLLMTHNAVFYLFVSDKFDSKITTFSYIAILVLVSVWPIFLIAFLVPQQGRLEEEDFKNKFTSMYLDNKTNKYLGEKFVKDRKLCYLYHVPFCVRRLCLVLSFFFFRDDQSLTLYAILVI